LSLNYPHDATAYCHPILAPFLFRTEQPQSGEQKSAPFPSRLFCFFCIIELESTKVNQPNKKHTSNKGNKGHTNDHSLFGQASETAVLDLGNDPTNSRRLFICLQRIAANRIRTSGPHREDPVSVHPRRGHHGHALLPSNP